LENFSQVGGTCTQPVNECALYALPCSVAVLEKTIAQQRFFQHGWWIQAVNTGSVYWALKYTCVHLFTQSQKMW